MILYYAELPGGERLFVDPVESKLDVVTEFKDSFDFANPGTNQEWLDAFFEIQVDFLEWAKDKIIRFPYETGECGCYTFDEWDFHLIKENITIQGEHRSCVVYNKKETTEPVNGIGTMEEWDEDGKLYISRKGFIIDGKLQGPGEKIEYAGNDDGGYIYRGEFKDDQLTGEGRFMSNYWTPMLGDRQLYLLSNWIEFCLDPKTTLFQIMDPLKGEECTFGAVQGGIFQNGKLNGDGFYLWGPTTDEYGIAIGNFSDNQLNGYGLDFSASCLRGDSEYYIKKGNFDKDKLRGNGCFAWLDPTDDFYLDDLFPLLKNELSVREFLLEKEHYVPKNYLEGNFTSAGVIGHGILVNYARSLIRSGPAYEEGVYEGDFLYDMQHGYGKYISDNLKYTGSFFANEFHGNGRKIIDYHRSSGDERITYEIYTGGFVCGLFHGVGQMVEFYGDGSAKVYEGNFDAGRLADGSHTVKIYCGISKEEITGILESDNCKPVFLPDEKFAESIQVKYLHGEEIG